MSDPEQSPFSTIPDDIGINDDNKSNASKDCDRIREPDNLPNGAHSKVVVQVLPSVDLGSIYALADLRALSGKSANGFSKSESSSVSSEMEATSDVDVLCQRKGISELTNACFPNGIKQASKRSLKTRKPFNDLTGTCSIHPGNGRKLSEIRHVVFELANSSPQVTRILHYILFDVYGLIANESSIERTRQNILQFSGFSFVEDTDMFRKKKKALENLPYPLLTRIHKVLMRSLPACRSEAVSSLLQFLQKPTDLQFSEEVSNVAERNLNDVEIQKLKSKALEAHPVVLLKRLNENLAEKLQLKNTELEGRFSFKTQKSTEKYFKPSFIHCGTGVHLKCFPEIVDNVCKARRRIVNLLHSILFGRPGSDNSHRQNILEFNGFTPFQKNYISRKMAYLKRLRIQELSQLCDVFSLRVKSGNKNKKIFKLLQFLSKPIKVHTQKIARRKQIAIKQNNVHGNAKSERINAPVKPIVKLKDFDTIRSKVECASPDSLSELNDLLFVKPCDNSEIHQKILDFTSFTFSANSFDFHCRKTLMHYMDIKTVRKIADLLDIENWENCRSHTDLCQNILNFLMNMKLTDRKTKPISGPKSKRLKRRPNFMKLYSCSDLPQSRSCSPENVDSTYASEEPNENELDSKVGPNDSEYKKKHTSCFSHPHKHGMFPTQGSTLIDSTPLIEFVKHPTDKELYQQIDKIISTVPLSITLGDLVQEVLKCYPNYNLQYRIEFIRNKTLEILQDLRESVAISPD